MPGRSNASEFLTQYNEEPLPVKKQRMPADRFHATRVWAAFKDALQGKASLSRILWVDGLLGSVLVSALGAFIDPSSERLMEPYLVFAFLYTVYVSVATYRCAGNCRFKAMTQFIRLSTWIGMIVGIPVVAYLYFSGAFNLIGYAG